MGASAVCTEFRYYKEQVDKTIEAAVKVHDYETRDEYERQQGLLDLCEERLRKVYKLSLNYKDHHEGEE